MSITIISTYWYNTIKENFYGAKIPKKTTFGGTAKIEAFGNVNSI